MPAAALTPLLLRDAADFRCRQRFTLFVCHAYAAATSPFNTQEHHHDCPDSRLPFFRHRRFPRPLLLRFASFFTDDSFLPDLLISLLFFFLIFHDTLRFRH